jgi:DNA mismatch repair ATPase MutS
MNHVEAQILDCVAKLYPEIFASLARFCACHKDFFDETIRVFDREIQFYVAYLEYIADLKRIGLAFCYPEVSDTNKDIFDNEGFDLALAHKRMTENATVVCNDFYLQGQERIFVVSGPNQGGKTTLAMVIANQTQSHFVTLTALLAARRA